MAAAGASPSQTTARSTTPDRTAPQRSPASAARCGRYNPATGTIIAPSRTGYIGGFTPSFSAVTRAAVKLPSGAFWALTNTAAPGFNRLASPGPNVTTGTSGGTITSDSPPL